MKSSFRRERKNDGIRDDNGCQREADLNPDFHFKVFHFKANLPRLVLYNFYFPRSTGTLTLALPLKVGDKNERNGLGDEEDALMFLMVSL